MKNAYASFSRIVDKFFSLARIPFQSEEEDRDGSLNHESCSFLPLTAETYREYELLAENRPPEEPDSEAIEYIRYLFIDHSDFMSI
ncbi:MAG: hypothetical protein MRQ13_01315 [Candidatus Midichloria sp.]|nr:hypothetical protein [Candidatus Midichloria sp.]